MRLRLLLFEDCKRKCKGCCNKDWDLKSIPQCKDFSKYECIMLTGGEPLLKPNIIKNTVAEIRKQTSSPIYLYTAKTDNLSTFMDIFKIIDGVTVTLHTKNDVAPFQILNNKIMELGTSKSLRLNVFKGVSFKNLDVSLWKVKDKIQWVKNSPLPVDEEFMRI